jgi:hypothetical protein
MEKITTMKAIMMAMIIIKKRTRILTKLTKFRLPAVCQ